MQDARTLTRVGLAQQVRARLLERIMDRDLAPGARLNIDALAREMGVSSSPLREALSALAARGLVRNEAFLGFSVAPMPDPGFLHAMFDTRLRLEPWLAAQAALRIGHAQLEQLRCALAAMTPEARHGPWQRHHAHAAADESFHATIAEASGNAPARQALAALNAQIHVSRLYLTAQTGAEETAGEHRRLLAALEAGDEAAAEAAMTAHLQGSRKRLLP
ncbi:GntR family transcriptional regulator [Elioraea sp.]|uniref:GntR family transcriptional regulator n=1 Tax=Elioraea sp. TaxID=2185103 RepID=UPI0025C30E91|nr:GntR family transcriptional regulator [Elioraea sp.]